MEIWNALQNVENGVVRGHPRSLKIASFDRAHTTSYSSLIGAIRLCCTVYAKPWIGPKSLYLVTPLALNAPGAGVPWDDFRKILHGGQRMAQVHSGEEILPKGSTLWGGCTNVTDRRQTIDRQTDLRQQRFERNVVTFG